MNEEVAFYTGAQVHGLLEFGDHNSRAPDFNMITATPGPVILSGVSFGGGAAVSESWAWNQLHPARPVNQLMLFDPVTPNTVPYPEDYVGDHLMNFNYDQVNNRITSGYSYFVVPSNLNARSWWQPFTEEDLPANHVYGQLGVATGYVSTNGLDQGPNGPAPSGPNEIIGTYHASQVFISSVLLEAANIMTGYVDQWHT